MKKSEIFIKTKTKTIINEREMGRKWDTLYYPEVIGWFNNNKIE